MAMTSFSLPKHWEDWIGAALGLWLLASPSVIPYGVPAASQNAFLGGVLLLAIAFVEITTFRAWEEWINVVLGAWLVVSPWVLGATVVIATTNLVIVGLLILALALYEIWDERRHLGAIG
jgi:SPW repeat